MALILQTETQTPSEPPPVNLADHCCHFKDKGREFGEFKSFVGIRYEEDLKHPLIYLPHGFPDVKNMSETELRSAIFTLIRTLMKNHETSPFEEPIEQHDGLNNDFPFESYRFIIQDYLNRGYIKESQRYESMHGSGRNHWQKTINKKPPLWTQQGAIHLNPIKIKTTHTHQILQEIQEYCLNTSYLALGWLYGKKPHPNYRRWNNTKTSQARNYLQQKKSTVFDERISMLLNHMGIVLGIQSNISRSERKIHLTGAVNTIDRVWEYMVESVFGTGKHTDYQPVAKWKYSEESHKNPSPTKPLKLDSIRWDNDSDGKKICTVIDAKYYPEGSLPSTSDINKQITYAEWVNKQDEEKGKHDEVQNVFILPGDLKNNIAKYEGYATMDILEDTKIPYHRVYAIRVDTLKLMKCYLQNDTTQAGEIVRLRAGSI